MNAEKLFLTIAVLTTAYSVVMTILFIHRSSLAANRQKEFIDLKADHDQLAQIAKEYIEKEHSDEER